MPTHSLQDAQDRAALYTLGALQAAEAHDFEAHLEGGCEMCRAELESFCAVATDLLLTSVAPPRPEVRTRVLKRISDDSLAGGTLFIGDGLQFVRAAQIAWEPVANQGMEVKVLFRDANRAYSAKLVRMAAGTNYPSHRHADIEEVFLLEGDLTVSGVLMQPGDYCRAEPGTTHRDVSTSAGCLFISMSSERDELLT
jgi:anti-sigma factor ChrR (cupin superfamily)